MRNAFIDTIIKAAEKDTDIFIVSGDAGLGVFDEFKKDFPRSFLNLGVAEQNATSFCAGLALTGHKVYLYSIIPFILYRNYEQVRNDICYQDVPVVLVGIGSGVTYAPQGMTHYSVEDLGVARTLPNLTVFSPIDPVEARLAALYSLTAKMPVYVRLPKRGEPTIHRNDKFDITKPQLIEDGKDIAIIFHGSVSIEVLKASEALRKEKIFPRLISVPMVQPVDFKAFLSLLKGVRYVVTVEEQYVGCGLGSVLAKYHAQEEPRWRLFTLGLPDKFIHEIKDSGGMREHFGISSGKIAKFIKEIL